jgi:hypothetical protein
MKTPVSLLLDEAHQYYVSDFILPFYTGTRKHGAGIKIFSQSCNNFPPNDIDIFLSTAAHLVAFGIGSRDAERIAKDILLPLDRDLIKNVNRDLYGPYGDTQYWSIAEQREHGIAEIMRQSQRRLFWRVRTANDIRLYLAETADQPKLTVPYDDEMAYREASARHHAPRQLPPPEQPQALTSLPKRKKKLLSLKRKISFLRAR